MLNYVAAITCELKYWEGISSGNHFGTKFSYIPFCFTHSRRHTSIQPNNHDTDYGAQLFDHEYKLNQAVLEDKRKTLLSSHGYEFSSTDEIRKFWQIANGNSRNSAMNFKDAVKSVM